MIFRFMYKSKNRKVIYFSCHGIVFSVCSLFSFCVFIILTFIDYCKNNNFNVNTNTITNNVNINTIHPVRYEHCTNQNNVQELVVMSPQNHYNV